VRLTQLELDCVGLRITVQQLTSALARMPLLAHLTVHHAPFASLDYVAAGTLPQTLTALAVHGKARLTPPAELQRLHALQHLTDLRLSLGALQCGKDDAALLYFQRPSALMPQLRDFQLII
jgi:hypothetical protein